MNCKDDFEVGAERQVQSQPGAAFSFKVNLKYSELWKRTKILKKNGDFNSS